MTARRRHLRAVASRKTEAKALVNGSAGGARADAPLTKNEAATFMAGFDEGLAIGLRIGSRPGDLHQVAEFVRRLLEQREREQE